MKQVGIAVLCGALVVITGCTLMSEHKSDAPQVDIPDKWVGASAEAAPLVEPWLDDFGDPKLSSLVREAVVANFDLQAAATRVEASRALAIIRGADRFPQITGFVDASRTKRNVSSGGIVFSASRNNSYGSGLDIFWEADIWGRLSNQARAALFDVEVSQAEFAAARLSLAANVARVWFDAIASELQVKLVEQTLQSFRDTLEVIEDGFRSGLNSALDVRLARANVSGAIGRLESQKATSDAVRRQLDVLAGRYPSGKIELDDNFPAITRNIPTGLPSELLLRRPDLIAAEQRVAATDERVNEANKRRLPSLVLTASGGTSSSELKEILDMDSLVWAIASALTAPIFQGGRLKAQSDLAIADSREALANYAEALLRAFQEVETALTAEVFLVRQEAALKNAANESIEAEKLALEQYREGLVDIITLLESQRRSFDAQQALITTTNQRLQNRINLYLALGGEFDQLHDSTSKQRDTISTMATAE
ncbi:MAG: efflux transporter outer membrane subunit [Gammaproteobacteria bacterium]|nr:efflux transporter outer membrane subunit [Gammaproteobacteria bacterium]